MSTKKNTGLTRRASGLMALEPRFMFDGAAVTDAVQTVTDSAPVVSDAKAVVPQALLQAEHLAQQKVAEFLNKATDQEVFKIFSGGKEAPDAAWAERLSQLRESLNTGETGIQLVMMDRASQFNAIAAFTAQGPDGKPTIFVNPYWAGLLGTEDLSSVLVEEVGHWMDVALNPGADTQGDEGQQLAEAVMGAEAQASRDSSAIDTGWVTVAGVNYEVEFASFNFVNAYEMVYDLNNSSNSLGVVNGAIDVTERWADKEQNLHYFNSSTSLGVVSISDGTNGQNFSGNDVSAIAVVVNGQTHYGWISRPIKANGIVRGFYFWTDTRFTSLAAAQADGNQDGDRTVLNNRGFVFVVDQAWFNDQINATKGTSTLNISNQKDGNLGSVWVANVGSSSDRVDSALNSVLTPNNVVAAADVFTVLEDSGGTQGNLFTNDSDPNGDKFVVSNFSVGGTSYSAGTTATLPGVGTIIINANGTFTFTPVANYAGPVPVIGYTITDDFGATSTSTLSISVTRVNDAPAGTDKTINTFENKSYTLSASDFGFTDPNDSPANSFLSVIITTLPTAGTLTLNGTAVTAGQEILVSALNGLVFTPAANANGSTYASLTFQVRDDGGTNNGGVNLDPSPNTLTFNVQTVNSPPLAVADTATVGEAGGVNNGTNSTPSVSGSVLSNDTDPDTGDTKTVSAVSGLNAGTVGETLAGRYGNLVLNANGSYTYTTDNENPAVQALRLNTDTLTDTFTYTVTDGSGLSSTTTLSITITGANDFPVAKDDYNSVKEAATATNGSYGSASGNVLSNDTDVDGGTLVVEKISAIVSGTDTLTVTSPITTATYTVVSAGGTNWNANGGIETSASPHNVLINGVLVTRTDTGAALTVYRDGTGSNAKLVFNHPATLYSYSRDTIFGVTNSTSLFKISSISAVVSSSTQIEVTGGNINDIAVGDTVSGTGIASGVTVTAINTSTKIITLSTAVQITSRDLTFSPSGGGGASSASITAGSSASVTGTYGTLNLHSDGSYTYNLTSDVLNDGEVKTETFSYTVNDSAGGSSSANLYIRIDGYTAVVVAATNDSYTVSEDTTLTVSAAGVLANDTAGSTVTGFTWGSYTGTIGSSLNYPGVGSLTLNSNGSFTFVPAADFNGVIPGVLYTITNGSGKASALLSITVSAVNDAPTAQADTAWAREAGGYDNDVAGYNPSGNVLTNDSDKDGDSLSVTAVKVTGSSSAGTVGQALAGSYGSLTLYSTGAYTYSLDNNNSTVQAMARGATLTESFTYTASDGVLGVDTTLVITLHGANDAPVNTVPGSSIQATEGVSTAISGLSVADVDDSNLTVRLSVTNGTLQLATTTGLTFTNGTNGQAVFTISGGKANINAALATLSYTSGATFIATDSLTVQTTDADGLKDIDSVPIVITDNRPLTVTGTTVNEASPFVMFQVAGAAGQNITLTLGNTADTTDVDAEAGLDFLPNLQYFDGTTWQNYIGGSVMIPLGGTTLLVRVPVLQDASYEGAERLTLTATNRAGSSSTPGVSTIKDDGTGDIFLGNNNSLAGNNAGDSDPNGPDYPAFLDDDRPITVNSIVVNEASPYAVFVVTGQPGQTVQLSMSNGTAVLGTDTASASTFEVYNGSGWVSYTAGTNLVLSGSRLSVRLPLTQDDVYEGAETFFLGIKQMGSGVTVYGKATILDDGNGTKFVFDSDANPTNDPETPFESVGPGAGFDDDRTLTINSPLVNEASDYVVFTLTGNSGQTVSLQLQDESNNGTVSGKANILENQTLKIWNGLDWVDYNASNLPTFNASGKIFVRVDIIAEQDAPFEGGETFKLNATLTGQSTAVTGVATIIDDGTGVKYPGTFTNGSPTTDATNLDNDRPTLSVTGGRYNEGSPRAVFTVNATAGQTLTLDVRDEADTGKAPTGDDEGKPNDSLDPAPIYYSLDGGATWQLYNGTPITAGAVPVLVAVDISNESDNVYEGEEQFTLVVTSGGQTASAFGTIVDDGTGTVYPPNAPNPDADAPKDDDRPVRVNNIEVNENSPWGVFRVNGTAGQSVTLALQNDNDPNTANAVLGTDSGTQLQYFNGTSWVNYSSAVTLPTGGELLVRVAITDDVPYEGPETFQLSATPAGGNAAYGTATILDDGTGSIYPDNTTGNPDADAPKDDDRPVRVNNIEVNENSPWGVFRVNGTAGQSVTLALQNDNDPNTANALLGTDSGTQLQYFNGTSWVNYTGAVTLPTGGELLVRVAINDDVPYEGPETFQLAVTPSGGNASYGTATILDDGTGNIYPDNPTGEPDPDALKDDDRPVKVNNIEVNEASPYAVFTITGTGTQGVVLALQNDNKPGTADAKLGTDTGNPATADRPLQYFSGSSWVDYTPGTTVNLIGGQLLVRTAIVNDTTYEGPETFQLAVTPAGGSAAYGTATILDDGTGDIYPNNPTGTPDPTAPKNDDRPVVVAPPPPPPAPPVPAAPALAPALAPPPPAVTPPQAFASALSPLAPALVPAEPPMSLGDAVTSGSGYQIPVNESAAPGLSLYQGITDQFVQTTGAATKVSLPFDAFIHSNKDAVIKLEAKRADDSKLPDWVQFDPSTGVFEVSPPKGFKGKLDLKVLARDDDGREAVAIFQMFIGEQTDTRPQSRDSFSEKLRMAGKRPITLVRVAEAPHKAPVREAMPARVRAG